MRDGARATEVQRTTRARDVTSPRQMLTDTVYEVVRRRLVDHDIEPGGKLNINALAQELDVSPTPVREALARLESDGMLIRRSLAGYAAAPLLGATEFGELFEMRSLGAAAAAKAANRITEAELASLAEDLAAMRDARDLSNRESRQAFFDHDAHSTTASPRRAAAP